MSGMMRSMRIRDPGSAFLRHVAVWAAFLGVRDVAVSLDPS
jgi:hypothetical protein